VPNAGRAREADRARSERHGAPAYHIRRMFAYPCGGRSTGMCDAEGKGPYLERTDRSQAPYATSLRMCSASTSRRGSRSGAGVRYRSADARSGEELLTKPSRIHKARRESASVYPQSVACGAEASRPRTARRQGVRR
jgi:hypothetical protein